MSEPIARRRALVDYRISATRCQQCGRVYFPPKSFCNIEGRRSEMRKADYFYHKGEFYSGAVVNIPTNKFKDLGSYLSAVVRFQEGDFRIPGRFVGKARGDPAGKHLVVGGLVLHPGAASVGNVARHFHQEQAVLGGGRENAARS